MAQESGVYTYSSPMRREKPYGFRERERERERERGERERERERERQRDRERQRETERDRDRDRERERQRETETETERQRQTETDRERVHFVNNAIFCLQRAVNRYHELDTNVVLVFKAFVQALQGLLVFPISFRYRKFHLHHKRNVNRYHLELN